MAYNRKFNDTCPPISYINVKTKERRGFYTQQQANDFIDSVEEPSIWDIE